jgi:intracellular multiplication protein IcmE
MADTMNEQKKSLFGSNKARTILVVLATVFVIFLVIGYFSFHRAVTKDGTEASIAGTPLVKSIPGVGTPSREYVKLQEQQNVEAARQAEQEKGAAIPTLTSTTYTGGAEGLAVGVAKQGCDVESLRNAKLVGVSVEEVRCKGCDVRALKAAGYTAGELANAGFSAQQLRDSGFTDQQLKDAGFGPEATLQNTPQCAADKVAAARANGITAEALKGCGIAALKTAGFSPMELKNAGFSAGELRKAGFTANDLKNAGYTAQQLHDAGFPPSELKNAGFAAQDLKTAGFSDGDILRAGFVGAEVGVDKCSFDNIRNARNSGMGAASFANCNPNTLKAAGFSDDELKNAGISGVATVAPEAATEEPGSPSSAIVSPSDKQQAIADQLEQIREQQNAALTKQEQQDKVRDLQQNMLSQASELFATWTAMPKQQYAASSVADKEEAGAGGGAGAGNAGGQAGGNEAAPSGPIIKAGTIFFATLDTGINSDEQSPILATIVQGRFKGAKLMGKFDRVDKKVALQFSLLNVPQLDKSVTINAYAIDPNTARTALSSSVDSHYLLRYGTLFASSFMEGLGQAIQQSGSTTVDFGNGSIQTVYKNLNTTEQVLTGLGQVGQTWGQQLGNIFNTPPTVKVEPGMSIGILLMQDLQIPCPDIGGHAQCTI